MRTIAADDAVPVRQPGRDGVAVGVVVLRALGEARDLLVLVEAARRLVVRVCGRGRVGAVLGAAREVHAGVVVGGGPGRAASDRELARDGRRRPGDGDADGRERSSRGEDPEVRSAAVLGWVAARPWSSCASRSRGARRARRRSRRTQGAEGWLATGASARGSSRSAARVQTFSKTSPLRLKSWVTGHRRSVSDTNAANCSGVASVSTVARTTTRSKFALPYEVSEPRA